MTAVDGIRALQWWEDARRWLVQGGAWVVGCAIVVLAAYGSGDAHGAAHARAAVADSVRHVLADSSRAIEARVQARTPVIAAMERHTDTVRVRYRADSARVQVVSDTLLRVDSLDVPVLPPIAERIRSDDSLIAGLTTLDSVHVAQLADVTLDRDTWKARAQLDEANTPKPPRFGFKSGVAAGVAALALLLHFLH